MNWPQSGTLLGAGFAVMAVLLLAISPVGWLAGWWHFSFAFRLMAASGVAGSAAAIVSLLTLMVGWSELNVHDVTIAGVAAFHRQRSRGRYAAGEKKMVGTMLSPGSRPEGANHQ